MAFLDFGKGSVTTAPLLLLEPSATLLSIGANGQASVENVLKRTVKPEAAVTTKSNTLQVIDLPSTLKLESVLLSTANKSGQYDVVRSASTQGPFHSALDLVKNMANVSSVELVARNTKSAAVLGNGTVMSVNSDSIVLRSAVDSISVVRTDVLTHYQAIATPVFSFACSKLNATQLTLQLAEATNAALALLRYDLNGGIGYRIVHKLIFGDANLQEMIIRSSAIVSNNTGDVPLRAVVIKIIERLSDRQPVVVAAAEMYERSGDYSKQMPAAAVRQRSGSQDNSDSSSLPSSPIGFSERNALTLNSNAQMTLGCGQETVIEFRNERARDLDIWFRGSLSSVNVGRGSKTELSSTRMRIGWTQESFLFSGLAFVYRNREAERIVAHENTDTNGVFLDAWKHPGRCWIDLTPSSEVSFRVSVHRITPRGDQTQLTMRLEILNFTGMTKWKACLTQAVPRNMVPGSKATKEQIVVSKGTLDLSKQSLISKLDALDGAEIAQLPRTEWVYRDPTSFLIGNNVDDSTGRENSQLMDIKISVETEEPRAVVIVAAFYTVTVLSDR